MEPAVKSKTWARNRLIRDGIYQAIYEQMKVDRSIYLFGEGSHMKVHFDAPYIEKEFPNRIITLPISEDGNSNFAVGTSLVGIKPIVDVISSDFLFRTMDSICVTPDTLVLGDNKPIGEYVNGDNCFGQSGRVPVERVYRRRHAGTMLEIKAAGLLAFKISPEHPVLAVSGECVAHFGYQTKLSTPCWKEAGALVPKLGSSTGDYLIVPRLKGAGKSRVIDLTLHIAPQQGNRNRGIVKSIPLTMETAWLIGLYVAEGFLVTTRRSRTPQYAIRLTVGKHETDLVEKAKAIAESVGINGRVFEKANVLWLELYSVPLARYLVEQCGRGARSKRIPELILLHSDLGILTAFLEGYAAGDGCVVEDRRPGHSPTVSCETASLVLAQQLQLAWARLGILAGISVGKQPNVIQGRQVEPTPLYHVRFARSSDPAKVNRNGVKVLDDYIATPVRRVRAMEYRGDVCNLETGDNTYLVSNAVVHNCNTAAKLNHVSADIDKPKTIVIRSEFFLGGPTTGQRPESLFTHIPGLNVVLPSNPKDARGLMRTALTNPGVTIFFEDRMINDSETKESDKDTGVTEIIPLGKAKVRRTGTGLTVVSYALALKEVEAVAENHKVDCDLIDPRTLYPLDFDTICDSVSKTGRLLIVEPDVTYAGIGAEIAASVVERAFSALKRPIRRLGAPRTVIPASQGLHKYVMPSRDEILREMRELSN